MIVKGLVCFLCVVVFTSSTAYSIPPVPTPKNVKLYKGTYFWNNGSGEPSQLAAKFTEKKDRRWKVTLTATFSGDRKVYRGEAFGDLENGSFTGEVSRRGSKRVWGFEGESENGVLTASHYELRDGEKELSGTFDLSPTP